MEKDPLIAEPPGEPPEVVHLRPDTEAVLHRACPLEAPSLNPLTARSYDTHITELLFDRLFVVDASGRCAPNAALVASVAPSQDGRVWTVNLRPGLTWHDGAPFTARDVEFTWEHFIAPEQEPLLSVTAADRDTVEFTHRETVATAMWDMRFHVLPRHRYEALGGDASPTALGEFLAELAHDPVGNGPFRLAAPPAEGQIILERWDEYPGPRPYTERVVFHLVTDNAERLRMLADGELDEVGLSAEEFRWDVNGESYNDHVVKVMGEKWQYDHICWNMDGSNPFFADRRVRRRQSHGRPSVRQLCFPEQPGRGWLCRRRRRDVDRVRRTDRDRKLHVCSQLDNGLLHRWRQR